MSDSSDVSSFETTVDDFEDTKSESESTSTSEVSENDDQENIDSVKASTSKNKSFQRKSKPEGARVTRKVRYVYPPKAGEKDERISLKIMMTPFEYAEIIGELTEKISQEKIKIHPKYADYPTVDLLKIAKMMIDDTSIDIPLMYKRPIDNPTNPTIVEIFKVRELMTPDQRLFNHIEKYMPKSDWRVF